MSDTTNTDQGTVQATDQAAVPTGEAAPAKLYPTRADAEANKPAEGKKRLFEISKNGTAVGWLWANGYDNALAAAAKVDGYSVSTGNNAPVTKEAVASKLAEFSDAELAVLGLSRKKGKK